VSKRSEDSAVSAATSLGHALDEDKGERVGIPLAPTVIELRAATTTDFLRAAASAVEE